jgi:serine O-acetyltransferase
MAFGTVLTSEELTGYLGRLIAHLIPDGRDDAPTRAHVDHALERLERCFAGIHRKYYTVDGSSTFDHLNGDHLAMFLYLVANTVWTESSDRATAAKLFAANKALHGLDLFYTVRMPEVFLFAHPLGSVIGNAQYGEELFITQNCTIGNIDGAYPRLGHGVALFAGATIIGDVEVGDDVVFGARSFVVDTDVPPHSVVVGAHPGHRILPNHRPVHERVFDPRMSR